MLTRSHNAISAATHEANLRLLSSPKKQREATFEPAHLEGDLSVFPEDFAARAVFTSSQTVYSADGERATTAFNAAAHFFFYFRGVHHFVLLMRSEGDAVAMSRGQHDAFVMSGESVRFHRHPVLASKLISALSQRDFASVEACLHSLNSVSAVEPLLPSEAQAKYRPQRHLGKIYLNEASLSELRAYAATRSWAAQIVEARKGAPFVSWTCVRERIGAMDVDVEAMKSCQVALTRPDEYRELKRDKAIAIGGSRGRILLTRPKSLTDPRLLPENEKYMLEQRVVCGPAVGWPQHKRRHPRWH